MYLHKPDLCSLHFFQLLIFHASSECPTKLSTQRLFSPFLFHPSPCLTILVSYLSLYNSIFYFPSLGDPFLPFNPVLGT